MYKHISTPTSLPLVRSSRYYELDALKQHIQESYKEADRLGLEAAKHHIKSALTLIEDYWEQER